MWILYITVILVGTPPFSTDVEQKFDTKKLCDKAGTTVERKLKQGDKSIRTMHTCIEEGQENAPIAPEQPQSAPSPSPIPSPAESVDTQLRKKEAIWI